MLFKGSLKTKIYDLGSYAAVVAFNVAKTCWFIISAGSCREKATFCVCVGNGLVFPADTTSGHIMTVVQSASCHAPLSRSIDDLDWGMLRASCSFPCLLPQPTPADFFPVEFRLQGDARVLGSQPVLEWYTGMCFQTWKLGCVHPSDNKNRKTCILTARIEFLLTKAIWWGSFVVCFWLLSVWFVSMVLNLVNCFSSIYGWKR